MSRDLRHPRVRTVRDEDGKSYNEYIGHCVTREGIDFDTSTPTPSTTPPSAPTPSPSLLREWGYGLAIIGLAALFVFAISRLP